MNGKGFWIAIAIIVGIFGAIVFISKQDKAETETGSANTPSQNYYGKLDSPVTVTEFVDFQCEACYAYYPTVKQIKEKYKDSVRFQVRNFPIDSGHQHARLAARSAQAAALQGKFWEMHNKIFEGQKTWEQVQDPQVYFDQYAKDLGLDMQKFETDRMSPATNDVINTDLKAVREIGGNGTPTFAINGKKIETPRNTVEAISAVIDQALEDAGQTNR